MASTCIAIESDIGEERFYRALNEAGAIATNALEVRTRIDGDTVLKIVSTECPRAISVFRSLGTVGAQDG